MLAYAFITPPVIPHGQGKKGKGRKEKNYGVAIHSWQYHSINHKGSSQQCRNGMHADLELFGEMLLYQGLVPHRIARMHKIIDVWLCRRVQARNGNTFIFAKRCYATVWHPIQLKSML